MILLVCPKCLGQVNADDDGATVCGECWAAGDPVRVEFSLDEPTEARELPRGEGDLLMGQPGVLKSRCPRCREPFKRTFQDADLDPCQPPGLHRRLVPIGLAHIECRRGHVFDIKEFEQTRDGIEVILG